VVYSRYIDDLTFSSSRPIGKRKRRALRDIIRNAGFPLSHRKSFVVDTEKERAVICGVGLYKGRIFVPRAYLKHLRGLVHKAAADSNISKQKVEGKMGVFRLISSSESLNRTEEKLLVAYAHFKRTRY